MNNKKNYFPTALALYFIYFIHGIGVSVLGQYKQNFAGAWGAKTLANGTFDVSVVLAVIAALGLGRLITLPISGPFSDKFGRRASGLIGIALYVAYFVGIAVAPNMYVAYAFALAGGAANSFLDVCIIPSYEDTTISTKDADETVSFKILAVIPLDTKTSAPIRSAFFAISTALSIKPN